MFRLLYNWWHSRMCSYCIRDATIKVVTHENKTKYICPDCWRSIRFQEHYYFKKAEDIPYKYKKKEGGINMFKKILVKTHTEETREIEAIETWMVKWLNFTDTFGIKEGSLARATPKFQAFCSYEDAKAFADQIDNAYKLIGIKYSSKITKQENGL